VEARLDLVPLLRGVEAVADADQPHAPEHQQLPRLDQLPFVARGTAQIIDEQDVERAACGGGEHLLVAEPSLDILAARNPFVLVALRVGPPFLPCGVVFIVPEPIRDAGLALAFAAIPPIERDSHRSPLLCGDCLSSIMTAPSRVGWCVWE